MIRQIQRLAITRPVATSMFYTALVLMGALSLSELEVNLLPNIEYPRLTIMTIYSGAAPEEIESLVTKPISEAISTTSGLDKVSSESFEGVSLITVRFKWGTQVDFAAMEVREKIDLIRTLLPQDASRSIVMRFDPAQEPLMEIVFFARSIARERDLRHFLKKEVKLHLDRIDGVAMAQFSGGYHREIHVNVDQSRMLAHGLNLTQLADAIDSSNVNVPAGSITVGNREILVRTIGEYQSFSEIASTTVATSEKGVPVQLNAVAEILDSYKERTGLARYGGEECVIVALYKEAGKNTVEVSENIHNELANLRQKYPEEFELKVVYDEARFVQQSIDNMSRSLILGSLLAFLSLILILRNFRSPLILVSVVPVALLTTFIFMRLQGVTLNMMSLGGLALGVGMLFDSSNVVLSAIERQRRLGMPPREAALKGAGEVAGSVTAAVLTTTIVFFPIIFLKGVVGVIFAEMALTITCSLAVSLVVSLTLIPMLSSLPFSVLTKYERASFIQKSEYYEARLQQFYAGRLTFFFHNPRHLVILVSLFIIFAILAYPSIKKEFVPQVDTGEFAIEVRNNRNASLESTAELVTGIERTVAAFAGVKHLVSVIGYDDEQLLSSRSGDTGMHRARLRVVLDDGRNKTAREFSEYIRPWMKVREDIGLNFVQSGDVLARIMEPERRPIVLNLAGEDLETITSIGERIAMELRQMEGVFDVESSMEERTREIHVKFKRDRVADAGLSHLSIGQFMQTAVRGTIPSKLRINDDEIDIRLRFRKDDRSNIQDLDNLRILASGVEAQFLSQLAEIREKPGYATVRREGHARVNKITANIDPRYSNKIIEHIEGFVKRVRLPEGYKLTMSGEKEERDRSFLSLGFAFLLAAVFIYMLLAAQTESFMIPVIMMTVLPLILVGVFPALVITGESLNINSFTGIILLIGIAVDNSVLYNEYVNIFLEEGHQLQEALLQAAGVIMRPVMMNNGTTVLGLLPVALGFGEGAEFQSSMAVAVISGLLTSMLLSLFVLPLVFFQYYKRNPAKILRITSGS